VEIPDTRYASSGGISIAYQVHGESRHDLLFAGTTASNIETIWHLPEAARFFERLGAFARVIRFDRRDTGISDPTKEDLTLEAHAEDALAVMDAVGAERPFLLGGIEACRSLAVLAATHPDRVAGLVAICPSARGSAVSAPAVADEVAAAVADMTWPDSVLDVWAPTLTRDPARRRRVASYIRTAATPVQVERLLRLSLTSNVADVLPLVQTPTLVLRPVDAHMPEEPQREFADLVEGSIYEEIPGDAVFIYGLDVDRLAARIEGFVTGTTPKPVTDRVLATILFTDLARSTQRAAELGDREWTALLARHFTAAQGAVASHGGEIVKSLGDGVLATFTGPAHAVRCASALIADTKAMGLELRAGVHTGEVARSGDDVAGVAVHIAARIMALADVGEILVSRTVRDLVVGSELTFDDRGAHDLEGIPEPWSVYSVSRPR
jgi:class 3 adenylate cyclase